MKLFATMAVLFALAIGTQAGEKTDRMSKEEAKFMTEGPRLYTMDKALELSKETGKPVVCWVGKHLFADERARKLSAELGDTTIQAVMDATGEEGTADLTGKVIPTLRVKFSSNNYRGNQQTRYVPVEKMDREGLAEAMLKFCRGGSSDK